MLLLLAPWSKAMNYEEYSPHTYPDSDRDWELCGLSEQGLACDPSSILNFVNNNSGLLLIEEKLQKIRKNSKCICDDPELQGKFGVKSASIFPKCFRESPRGFTISVAVLKKIYEGDLLTQSKQHLAMVFSTTLLHRLERGQCNDDAIIVLSVLDSSVWTATGQFIEAILTQEFITNASQRAKHLFMNRDYSNGLLQMIEDFADRLEVSSPDIKVGEAVKVTEPKHGGWFDEHLWSAFPEWIRKSELKGWTFAVLLIIFLLFVVLIVFTVMKQVRQGHNSNGYAPGKQTQTEL